ncbi:MAG: hypothetical protein Q9185_004318 [Variospora sp. 1 TL-2023]
MTASDNDSPEVARQNHTESELSTTAGAGSVDLEKLEGGAGTDDSVAEREMRGAKWLIVVTAILSTTLLFSLDNTVVADVQPKVVEQFGSISKLPWLGAAFALGSAASILPCAICGAAPSMNVLIVGRAIAIDLQPNISATQRLRSNDWLGILIFAGMMSSFVMAISFGGSIYDWDAASEIALWVVTGALFCTFALTQVFHPLVPEGLKLYPTRFFRKPTLLMLQVLAFCAAFCLFIPTYYIPLFFQFAKDDTALEAAVHTVTAKTSKSAIYGYSVLMGIGAGSFLQASFSVSQALVGPEDIPDAVGLISVGQSVGIVISLAIAGAIYQNTGFGAVQPLLPSLSPSNVRSKVIDAIIATMGRVYLLAIAGGALTFVLGLCLPVSTTYDFSNTAKHG